MTKKAIIYARWSTLEQGNSDRSSEERQIIATTSFCDRQGWEVAGKPLIDSGRSAFTGENLTKGELGKLTKRLLSNAIDLSETILVVEELDRLSRRPPGEMSAWIMPLLASGLTVAIANTGQIVTLKMMNEDFGGFVTLMSQAFSAYEFSRKQRERGNGSWSKRRRSYEEDGIALARMRGRKWLAWNEREMRFDPIPERVAVVEEMFRLRLAGHGKAAITKLFNERAAKGQDEYRVWVSTTKKQPERWTVSAVGRIVQDPAVTGYLQFAHSPRGKDRTPIGDPVKVFPEIISPETFARANDTRLTNQLRVQGRGRAVSNLLGPLARCGTCDGIMAAMGSARTKVCKDGSTTQHYFLYCQTNKLSKGASCTNARGWPYSKIETPVLDKLMTRAMDDQYFQTDDDLTARLEGRVAILSRQLINQQNASKRILAAIGEDDGDDIGMEAYHASRERITKTKEELGEASSALADAKGQASPAEHVVRVSELREQMQSDDEEERYQARSMVKLALANILDRIVFEPEDGTVWAELIRGLGMVMIPAPQPYARGPERPAMFYERADVQRGNADAALRNASTSEKESIRAYMERRVA